MYKFITKYEILIFSSKLIHTRWVPQWHWVQHFDLLRWMFQDSSTEGEVGTRWPWPLTLLGSACHIARCSFVLSYSKILSYWRMNVQTSTAKIMSLIFLLETFTNQKGDLRERYNDKEWSIHSLVLHQIGYQANCLNCFSQSHFISQDSIQVVVKQWHHPFQTFDLKKVWLKNLNHNIHVRLFLNKINKAGLLSNILLRHTVNFDLLR